MDSGGRGMNHVAMTIINPRKEYVRAGDRTNDLGFSSPVRYRPNYGAQWIGAYMFKSDSTKYSMSHVQWLSAAEREQK